MSFISDTFNDFGNLFKRKKHKVKTVDIRLKTKCRNEADPGGRE